MSTKLVIHYLKNEKFVRTPWYVTDEGNGDGDGAYDVETDVYYRALRLSCHF